MGGDVRMTSVYGSGSEFTATIRQQAGSSKKLASLADPGQKRVLFFKEAEARHLSIMSALKELGVPEPKLVERRCDFIKEFVTGLHDYAFISSRYALRCFRGCEQQCLEVCQEENPRTRLVVMAAFGDAAAIPGTSNIAMPVYCVPLANALNGASSSEHRVSDANGLPLFSAPEATVLVVDDVLTNLRVAREFMDYYGIAVETCMDGPEALEMVEDRRYDLIFMDHMMPKMNGLEATLRIRRLGRNDEYFRNVPIVALTANAVVGQREIFLEHGFNDFLPKPLEAQALDAVLKKWLPLEKQRAIESPARDARAVEAVARPDLVEGLDMEKGIKNVGGRKSAYAGTLSVFRQDCGTLTPRLLTALVDGDLSAYAIAAHALKGSLRTIGAEKLAFSAMRLENAASNGDAGFLKEETQSFLNELQTLTGSFDLVLPVLTAQGKAGNGGLSAENAALPRKLDELKQALNSMDAQAVNDLLTDCLGMELSPGQRTLINEIDMLVMDFEFEEAVARIDDFLA
jgi:CheY-like chemotaxis protein